MPIKKIKISELPQTETLEGFKTIGVNAENESVQADLTFVGEAAQAANTAAETASTEAENAQTAATAAAQATEVATTAAVGANGQADYAKAQGNYAKSQGEAMDQKAEEALRAANDYTNTRETAIVTALSAEIAAAAAAAKAYADQKRQELSDSFDAKLTAAVAELKAHVQITVGDLVNNAPEALDTLQELSAALGDNPNFATEVATALGQRVTNEALLQALAGYVPKSGDTTIAGTLTATDFKITE